MADLVRDHAFALQGRVKNLICKFEARLSDSIDVITSFIGRQEPIFKEMLESLSIRMQALESIVQMKTAVKLRKRKIKPEELQCVLNFPERPVDMEIRTDSFGVAGIHYTDIVAHSNGYIAAYSQSLNQTDVYKDGKLVHSSIRKVEVFAVFKEFLICDHEVHKYDPF